ncbi:MAG TPA: hypothetical protein VEB19_18690 [Gemmatimonadaceae bacterium]|nr:hypothetical protein [Gemmatimonadaceae bacterium]
MRITLAAFVLLLPLVPSTGEAQRIPSRPRGGPARPTPTPELPPGIAREMNYRRLPVSVETYPMVSRVVTSGFEGGGVRGWTSFGMGTRADYRVMKYVSATLDMTSAMFGGPALTQTLELGTRFRPERNERRLYPFVDLRIAYVHAFDGMLRGLDFVDPVTAPVGPGTSYSHGVATVAGGGLEYALTRTLSLTTSASQLHSRMHPYSLSGVQPDDRVPYRLTSYRYTLGVRWNPVRFLQGLEQK